MIGLAIVQVIPREIGKLKIFLVNLYTIWYNKDLYQNRLAYNYIISRLIGTS